MNTLLLDTAEWDLCKDVYGNIAMASNPYAIAQDVASALKLFSGELYYDNTKGVPYFGNILGQYPAAAYVKSELIRAALTVPEVVKAQVLGIQLKNGILSGTVEVIDVAGQANNVSF